MFNVQKKNDKWPDLSVQIKKLTFDNFVFKQEKKNGFKHFGD